MFGVALNKCCLFAFINQRGGDSKSQAAGLEAPVLFLSGDDGIWNLSPCNVSVSQLKRPQAKPGGSRAAQEKEIKTRRHKARASRLKPW